jgi:hypothetical protein
LQLYVRYVLLTRWYPISFFRYRWAGSPYSNVDCSIHCFTRGCQFGLNANYHTVISLVIYLYLYPTDLFLFPWQGNHISCKEGRIHCSLNINTETGRLSARTPNLQVSIYNFLKVAHGCSITTFSMSVGWGKWALLVGLLVLEVRFDILLS